MKATNILIFVLGAAVGAAASYAFAKKRFTALAQEEINSVKEVYSKRQAAREKPDLSKFAEIVKSEGYSSDSAEKSKGKRPHVISPDEFAEDDEYEKISLTLYADGVLTDDNDDIIKDVDRIVGEENLNSFGAFEEDSVFVRNEALKADYEILLDERKFAEVAAKSPHKIG